jgi:methionine-rich copper-binding protein CopC
VRLHDQNSIVVVRAEAPVTLRVYRSDWHAVSGDSADLEWA